MITHDPTTEGIRDLLVHQDRGIVVVNDEWSRFIGSMGRYSGGKDASATDRAFYNVAYDGGEWNATRANKTIAVNNLQVTVVGGIQPSMLRQFNRNDALTGDGLLQRACPILMSKKQLVYRL